MARQLHRELNNRHIQLIAIGGADWYWIVSRFWTNDFVNWTFTVITYMIIGIILFAFMRALGELLLSNSRFNSFVDIAMKISEASVIGWTYWICWVVSSMSI